MLLYLTRLEIDRKYKWHEWSKSSVERMIRNIMGYKCLNVKNSGREKGARVYKKSRAEVH